MDNEVTEKALIKSLGQNRNEGQRFAFLLGAGASVTSGIKGAADLAAKWLTELEEIDPQAHQLITSDEEFDADNVAASYTNIYRARFTHFPKDGYNEIENIVSANHVQPSFGYTVLAQVLAKTRHNIVLTTNFDRLTETALLYYQNIHARVIAHEEMLRVIVIHDQKPSIIKVHRDVHFSPMSDAQEVEELDPKWKPIVRSLLEKYHLICLGYGGNDNGLMKIIEEEITTSQNTNIYWCYQGNRDSNLEAFAKAHPKVLKTVKVKGFDEFMLHLNSELEFKLLDKKIEEIAERRKQNYQEQLKELTETTKDSDDEDALKKLAANTWWEVELLTQKASSPEEKNRIFEKGLNDFPNSHELHGSYAVFLTTTLRDYDKADKHFQIALKADHEHSTINGYYALFLSEYRQEFDRAEEYFQIALKADEGHANNNKNYANFLANIRKDYERAEKHHQVALKSDSESVGAKENYAIFLTRIRKNYDKAEELFRIALKDHPKSVRTNARYANFLTSIRKDYDKAEEYYKIALATDSQDGATNGNYAVFLNNIRNDYEKAEKHYQISLNTDPESPIKNGNYAGFLLEQSKKKAAIPHLEKAEKSNEAKPDLLLELAFYRLALFPELEEESRKKISALLDKGVRSKGWDFSRIIIQAEKEGCTFIGELKNLAYKISAND